MKKSLVLVAVASTTLLSANQYYQQPYYQQPYYGSGSCPGGNCPAANYNQGYQGGYQGTYQDAGYYQGGQGYQGDQNYNYGGRVYRHDGAGYHGETQTYIQGGQQTRDGYYDSNVQYNEQGNYQDRNRNVQYNQDGRAPEGTMDSQPTIRGTSPSNANPSTTNPSNIQDSQRRYDRQTSYQDKPATYTNNQRREQRTVQDQDIAKEVHNVLAGWFTTNYPNVTFDVNNGVVSLNGTVDKAEDKTKIENEVKKIEGVRQVDSKLTVGGVQKAAAAYYKPSSMTANVDKMTNSKQYSQDTATTEVDKQLNLRVRDRLNNNGSMKTYDSITLKTTNGVVTVSGTVETREDIRKIVDTIKSVEGVKSVNNQLTSKQR